MTTSLIRELWQRNRVLWILLGADVVFIGLYAIYGLTEVLTDPRFGLIEDWSYGESFNYLKELSIVVLLVFMAFRRRSYAYLVWAAVFTYILADDSTQIHERMGEIFAAGLGFTAVNSWRAVDFGELLWFGLSGTVMLSGIYWGYRIGGRAEREMATMLGLLLLALAFFGVALDMPVIRATGLLDKAWGAAEDGGEMLVLSVILWQVVTRARSLWGTGNVRSRHAGVTTDGSESTSGEYDSTVTTGAV